MRLFRMIRYKGENQKLKHTTGYNGQKQGTRKCSKKFSHKMNKPESKYANL